MMVAVDSSVLIAIFRNEARCEEWLELLIQLRAENHLTACDVVWSEVGPLFASLKALKEKMSDLGVGYNALDESAAFEAGRLFVNYRRRGGSRSRIIPDFMIAAHALQFGGRLVTADADFMATNFPKLRLLHL